jgi:hypothetical protein
MWFFMTAFGASAHTGSTGNTCFLPAHSGTFVSALTLALALALALTLALALALALTLALDSASGAGLALISSSHITYLLIFMEYSAKTAAASRHGKSFNFEAVIYPCLYNF